MLKDEIAITQWVHNLEEYMGIRITGISTPVGGVSWEYTEKTGEKELIPTISGQKIKVFISSKCGDNGKYDDVRARLKEAIENTNLADVYSFEDEGASTLSAISHYIWALKDSDVCLFLIDNADGIPPGVQNEIDTVKRDNIKALYYFCDENSTEKTALEQSLMGAHFAKSRTIHKFDDLIQDGARWLIDDIISIYHNFCKGRLIPKQENQEEEFKNIDIAGTEQLPSPTMPRFILKNIDKCSDYILKFILGRSYPRFPDEVEETSDIDEWGLQFLQVLLEGVSIKQFNTGMFLDTLQAQQTAEYFQVVQSRWKAIQSYFGGDTLKCLECLEEALRLARESKQPLWIENDILIDIRNENLIQNTIDNRYSMPKAQKELTDSIEEVYYPILDRLQQSINEKYIEGLYKKKTESPYTVTFGNNLNEYSKLLASSYIVAIYNGSLTHILLFYEKIKNFLFYLCCKYDDWNFRRDLFKFAIYEGKGKEIEKIKDSYPEILNNLTHADAELIMEFCSNNPIKYKQFISQLLAFGAVGYYLNDEAYKKYENIIVHGIKDWLSEANPIIAIGHSIFQGLSGSAHRMSQNDLAEICCMFMENHYSRWYMDMFKFIDKHMDLKKMDQHVARNLIDRIITALADEKERKTIQDTPQFLCTLRKQEKMLTAELDSKIAEYLPQYYSGDYKLETTEEYQDFTTFLEQYIHYVQRDNIEQGKDGRYFGHGVRYIAIVKSILQTEDFRCDSEIIDSIINTVVDTLLKSKESVTIKLDAVSLLIYIVVNYPDDYKRNINIFNNLFEKKNEIDVSNDFIMSSNIDNTSLKIGLQFLFSCMGKEVYSEILELMPYIQDDVPTTIAVTKIIAEYLESGDSIVLPEKIEAIVLQNALQWLVAEHLSIRWNATRILLKMLRNPENRGIINHQLVSVVNRDNVYIKNLIIRNIGLTDGISEATKKYIMTKCQNDPNFVVRMVCGEETTKLASHPN